MAPSPESLDSQGLSASTSAVHGLDEPERPDKELDTLSTSQAARDVLSATVPGTVRSVPGTTHIYGTA